MPGPEPSPPRSIRPSRRIAFVAVLVGLTLALCEALVRLVGLAPDLLPLEITTGNATFLVSANPRLGWVPKPGSADVNADGYRDRAFAVEKPPGTFRVAALGDSVTFGACVTSRDETFAKVAERGLDGFLGGVEVMNLGVPGYDTVQEVELLKERGLRYAPDLVLVGVCLNDFEPVAGAGPMAVLAESGTARGRLSAGVRRRLMLSSHLFRLVYARASASVGARDAGDGTASPRPHRGMAGSPVEEGLAELAALSAQHGFAVAIVLFPVFAARPRPDMVALVQSVAAEAARHGFRTIDLEAAYGDFRADPRAVSCDALHPNREGHRIAGEAIARALVASPELFGARADEVRAKVAAAQTHARR